MPHDAPNYVDAGAVRPRPFVVERPLANIMRRTARQLLLERVLQQLRSVEEVPCGAAKSARLESRYAYKSMITY